MDKFIPFIVGILTFLASEFFLHFVFNDKKVGHRQRHFYSILLAVFSFAMSNVTKTTIEIRDKIAAVERVFTFVSDSHMKQHFEDIFTGYHKHFRQPSSTLLAPWVDRAIKSLSTDIKEISVSLPSSIAKDEVFGLYRSAADHIVDTHVGSLAPFAQNQRYKNVDLETSKRGIPIVRFYVFDGEKRQFQDPDVDNEGDDVIQYEYVRHDGVTLIEFNERVRELHGEMKTLMSVVVPPNIWEASGKRHLLLVDGIFVAETKINKGIIRGIEKAQTVKEAREFFRDLMGRATAEGQDEYLHYMDKGDVRDQFGRHVQVYVQVEVDDSAPAGYLAKTLAHHLIRAR